MNRIFSNKELVEEIKSQINKIEFFGEDISIGNSWMCSTNNLEVILSKILMLVLDECKNLEIAFYDIFVKLFSENKSIIDALIKDLLFMVNNGFCENYLTALFSEKSYHALVGYRLSHCLLSENRTLALLLHGFLSKATNIDIHPAAKIASPICIDHGSGLVVGASSIIEKNVVLFHNVTLGSTLLHSREENSVHRHPILRENVIIGAGSTLIGCIEIGKDAMVGAGSIVTKNVPSGKIVAGNPAKIIGDVTKKQLIWAKQI